MHIHICTLRSHDQSAAKSSRTRLRGALGSAVGGEGGGPPPGSVDRERPSLGHGPLRERPFSTTVRSVLQSVSHRPVPRPT